MKKVLFALSAMGLVPFCAFAVDGVVLINQATVTAAGGFPYTISQPGSYRLSGNLNAANVLVSAAIRITASNVTLDLNGFSIFGPPTTPNTYYTKGIFADPGLNSTTIRNGTISGFGEQVVAQGRGGLFKDLILTDGGGTVRGDLDVGEYSVLSNITAVNSVLRVACPTVISQSVATGISFTTASSTGCVVHSTSGSF